MMKFISDYPNADKPTYPLLPLIIPRSMEDWVHLFNLWNSDPLLFDTVSICEEFTKFRQCELNKPMDCLHMITLLIACDNALLQGKMLPKDLRIDLLNDNINFLKLKLKNKLNSTQNLQKIVLQFESIKSKKRKDNYYELLSTHIKFKLNHLNEIDRVFQQFSLIGSDGFKPIISDFLLNHRNYILTDDYTDNVVLRIYTYSQKNLQDTKFHELMTNLITINWNKMQSENLSLQDIQKYTDNFENGLTYFSIIGVDPDQYHRQLQTLQIIFNNFIEIKDKVVNWIVWHQSLCSVGIPDRLKRVFLSDLGGIQLTEAVEIIEFVQNFIQNIEILYFLRQNSVFNQKVRNNFQVAGKSFSEIEDSFLNPIVKDFNEFSFCLFSHSNTQFIFGGDSCGRQQAVTQHLQKLNRKPLTFKLLKSNFNLVYIVDSADMECVLTNIQKFYSQFLQIPNAQLDKNTRKDLTTYIDIHIVFSRCRAIDKISKFFKFHEDSNVLKYKKIMSGCPIDPEMPLQELIKNKNIIKDFQNISIDFTEDQFYSIFLFSKILKILHLDCPTLPHRPFLIDLHEHVKSLTSFKSFFSILIPKIQNKITIFQELINKKKLLKSQRGRFRIQNSNFWVELNNLRIDEEDIISKLSGTQDSSELNLQVSLLKQICIVILDLKLTGHPDYQDWTKTYDICYSTNQMRQDLSLLQEHKNQWTDKQMGMFTKFPYLTLIPPKYYKNFDTYQETFCDLLLSIHESLDLSKPGLKQVQDLISRLGEFLNLNLRGLLPLYPAESENPQIYIIKFLESEQKAMIQQLIASITPTSKGFQYFFCAPDSSYQDLELFINRFNHLQIRREFYIINLQRTSTATKNRVFSQLKRLYRSKTNSSNKLILIYEIKSNNDWIGTQFLQFKKERQPLPLQTSRVYTSEYAGLGKSYHISKNSSKQVRIPLHSTYSTREIIALFRSKKIRDCDSIHLEITDTPNPHELDLLLFQIIILRVIQDEEDLVQIPHKIRFDIEVQNTIGDKLRKSLHVIDIFPEKIHLKYDLNLIEITQDISKPMQRTLRYLNTLRKGQAPIDFGQGYTESTGKELPLITQAEGRKLLREFFFNKIKKPNLYTLMFFIRFFGKQMKLLDASPFFSVYLAEDWRKIADLRHDMINLIYDVSLCQSIQSGGIEEGDFVQMVQKLTKFSDLKSDFVAFTTEGTIISCFRDQKNMPPVLLQMYQRLQEQGLETEIPDISTENQTSLVKWLIHLCNKSPSDVFKVYNATTLKDSLMPISLQNKLNELALSSDNFYKMALIYLRILAKMPAIPLGETGIGKTALIELLSKIMNYQFIKLDVHAGLPKEMIIRTVNYVNSIACKENKILLFFDEINTNSNINGLLKEIVVDHMFEGVRISPHIVVLATCNPYKMKKDPSDTLTTGLRNRHRKQEHLVYRVLPMSESMLYFIWNYDSLNIKDEIFYIKKIISSNGIFNSQEINNCILEQVFLSQQFIREGQNQWSCSLRDVKRFSLLSQWFVQVYFIKKHSMASLNLQEVKTRSLILALSFCYHIRLQSEQMRRHYREYIIGIFKLSSKQHSLSLGNLGLDPFQEVINEEYEFLISCLQSPQDIGRNISIKENIFVMFVCLFNKIPLILTGPPGSSKSISFSILKNSLRGQTSQDPFLSQFPKIKAFYHQGHLQSTSQQIEILFKQAIFKQTQYEEGGREKLVVVLIDEIGLAEISPHNPLKILHSLLEHPQISVLGLSNWALDASKMNRAVHLSRHPLSKLELIYTAGCILQEMSFELTKMSYYIEKIVNIYLNISNVFTQSHRKEAYGLRDFYNLIKFICSEWAGDKNPLDIIYMGFQRNFGGYYMNKIIIQGEFQSAFDGPPSPIIQNLIIQNLKERKSYSTRNLMVFTEDIESATFFVNNQFSCKIFFGSDFKDDFNKSPLIRNLTQCIIQGVPSIIINLKDIYECFYDILNQNYLCKDGKKIARVTHPPYSSWVEVHEDFKFIIIANFADREVMEEPFLNRFEKHEFSNIQMMNEEQLEVYNYLTEWVQTIGGEGFCFSDNNFISSIVIGENKGDLQNKALRRLISMSHFETAMRGDQPFKDIYFSQQHMNIYSYLHTQHNLGSQFNIVYTYQSITSSQLDVLKPSIVACVLHLSQIDSQQHLQDEITRFLESSANLLVIVCDLLVDSYQKIKLAKNILNSLGTKTVCLIIRMIEPTCKALHAQVWDQICIENLFEPYPEELKEIYNIDNLIAHPLAYILNQDSNLLLRYYLLQQDFMVEVLLQTPIPINNYDTIMRLDGGIVSLVEQCLQILNKFDGLDELYWHKHVCNNPMSFHKSLIMHIRHLVQMGYVNLFRALFKQSPTLAQTPDLENVQIITSKYPPIFKDLAQYYNTPQLDIDNEKKKYIMFQLRDFENKFLLYNKLTNLVKIINFKEDDPEMHIHHLMVRYWLLQEEEFQVLKDLQLNQLLNLIEALEYEMMDRLIDQTEGFQEVIFEDQSQKLIEFITQSQIDIDCYIAALGRFFIRKLMRGEGLDNDNLLECLQQEKQCWEARVYQLIQNLKLIHVNIKVNQAYYTYWLLLGEKDELKSRLQINNNQII